MINKNIELPRGSRVLYVATPSKPPTIYIKYRNSELRITLIPSEHISFKITAENKKIKNMFLDIIKQL